MLRVWVTIHSVLIAMNPGLLNTIAYASHGNEWASTIAQPHHLRAPTNQKPAMPTTSQMSNPQVHSASFDMRIKFEGDPTAKTDDFVARVTVWQRKTQQ